jgi:hypothetical protein
MGGMEMKKTIFAAVAMAGCFAMWAAVASAEVTGDFKVTGYGYANDVATVAGTVNNGAIQSRKTVVVDVTYDYSFLAEKTEIIPGETTTVTVFVPGKCVSAPNDNLKACFDKDGNPKGTGGAIWTGTYETSTTTTEPQTVTTQFNGTQGMTAITEPTIEKGRLNPKGKITGYNWTNTLSIVPNASLVDIALVPDGYSIISVTVNSVSYTAYLKDAAGPIADTVMSGAIYPAP